MKRKKGENFLNNPVKLACIVLLLDIFIFALYIRIFLPYHSVFSALPGVVRFGGNDPWYHMHLVKSMIYGGYFPQRQAFDAYTFFPSGSYLHFGALQTLIVASVSLIAGRILEGGLPSPYLIDTIGAYYPAILGALTIFPVYIIGKEVFGGDVRVGILSAVLIAIMPGQFLGRSLLGFTDHHIGETLFSTATIAFMILAIKSGRGVLFKDMWEGNYEKIKPLLWYSVMAGIVYGCYLLTWPYATLLILIIMLFAFIEYIADHIKDRSTDYLGIMGVCMFIPSLIMILIYTKPQLGFATGHYSLFPPTMVCVGILSFIIMGVLSSAMKKKEINRYYYPIALVVITLVSLVGIILASPQFANIIFSSSGTIYRTGGATTIGESLPLFATGLNAAYYNFAFGFFIAPITFVALFYMLSKKWEPEKTLCLVWCLVFFGLTLAQNRFAYYYATNIAIMTGFVAWKALEAGGFKVEAFGRGKIKGRGKSITMKDIYIHWIKGYCTLKHLVVAGLVFGFIFYPPALAPNVGSMLVARGGSGAIGYDWYTSMDWMVNNTTSPGFEYYTRYEEPQGEGNNNWYYNKSFYPESAYGVMSWWDYGHWIEIIGHRIPNSNPFQHGVGNLQCNTSACPWRGSPESPGFINVNLRPGAAPFFVEKNETKANEILDVLGSKYVVTDIEMASVKFYAMAMWAHTNISYIFDHYYISVRAEDTIQRIQTTNYFRTMTGKLHLLDGSNYEYENIFIPALKHHRLVYESESIRSFSTPDITKGADYSYVKIFEYVEGANVLVYVPENVVSAVISLNLTTNVGRDFKYVQNTTADEFGVFNFTVPYSTGNPLPNGTQFEIVATDGYIVTAGDFNGTINVSENQVMKGGTTHLFLV